MQLPATRESFDGRDLAAVALDAEYQARQYRFAVEQHRARAAFSQLAAVLRTGELQILTEHFQQRVRVVGECLCALAVDEHRQSKFRLGISRHRHELLRLRRVPAAPGAVTPRTRKSATASLIAAADNGPCGLNQVTVQFSAPSIARAMSAASPATNSPR